MSHGAQAFVIKKYPDGFVGYACDVGANDGSFESNTASLESLGWTVLCVEANPDLEQEGRTRRKLWRAVAAGSKNETRGFKACGGRPWASSSTISDEQGLPQVQVLTLDTILEQAGFPRLDFLTVDAEGWEHEIMLGFSVERWKPKVISLEHFDHGFNTATKNSSAPLAIEGYDPVTVFQFDVMYVRRDSDNA